jgi:hypothetical protein
LALFDVFVRRAAKPKTLRMAATATIIELAESRFFWLRLS